jgi:hypothetical protein
MIYIEAQDSKVGMNIKTELGMALEMCVAQDILLSLEKAKIDLPLALMAENIEGVDFRNAIIASGTHGDRTRYGNLSLLESICRILGKFKEVTPEIVKEEYDGFQLGWEYNWVGVLIKIGKKYSVLVEY